MPVATPEKYRAMLDAARAGGFAFPAMNVTSSSSLLAALEGFSEAESDGIVQISYGGAEFASGQSNKSMPVGATALAEFADVVAAQYPVNVALHTVHCPPDRVDGYIRPLLEVSRERRNSGQGPLFQSHMLDASTLPMEENLELASELLTLCNELDIVLAATGGSSPGVIQAACDAGILAIGTDVDRAIEHPRTAGCVLTSVMRDYDAAMMSAGHCGFGLGATSTAVANMQSLEQRYGASARAFLIVPATGGLLIDVTNAINITLFLNWLR